MCGVLIVSVRFGGLGWFGWCDVVWRVCGVGVFRIDLTPKAAIQVSFESRQ